MFRMTSRAAHLANDALHGLCLDDLWGEYPIHTQLHALWLCCAVASVTRSEPKATTFPQMFKRNPLRTPLCAREATGREQMRPSVQAPTLPGEARPSRPGNPETRSAAGHSVETCTGSNWLGCATWLLVTKWAGEGDALARLGPVFLRTRCACQKSAMWSRCLLRRLAIHKAQVQHACVHTCSVVCMAPALPPMPQPSLYAGPCEAW